MIFQVWDVWTVVGDRGRIGLLAVLDAVADSNSGLVKSHSNRITVERIWRERCRIFVTATPNLAMLILRIASKVRVLFSDTCSVVDSERPTESNRRVLITHIVPSMMRSYFVKVFKLVGLR